MSKIVVGMNRNPAIIPQRIDCGFLKTIPNPPAAAFTQPGRGFGSSGAGMRKYRTTLMARPPMPMPVQNVLHDMPEAMSGPTTNWPAEPPAMPNICVAPMSVAALDGGKLLAAM